MLAGWRDYVKTAWRLSMALPSTNERTQPRCTDRRSNTAGFHRDRHLIRARLHELAKGSVSGAKPPAAAYSSGVRQVNPGFNPISPDEEIHTPPLRSMVL